MQMYISEGISHCLQHIWSYYYIILSPANTLSFKRNVSRVLFSAGRIDHGHHDGKAVKALNDAVAMNKAVSKALEIVKKGK